MDKEEALQKLYELSQSSDTEEAHIEADGILLEMVATEIKSAYEDLVKSQGGFWYA